jgi:hypothetical protein
LQQVALLLVVVLMVQFSPLTNPEQWWRWSGLC